VLSAGGDGNSVFVQISVACVSATDGNRSGIDLRTDIGGRQFLAIVGITEINSSSKTMGSVAKLPAPRSYLKCANQGTLDHEVLPVVVTAPTLRLPSGEQHARVAPSSSYRYCINNTYNKTRNAPELG
jgi:hypothetical protein